MLSIVLTAAVANLLLAVFLLGLAFVLRSFLNRFNLTHWALQPQWAPYFLLLIAACGLAIWQTKGLTMLLPILIFIFLSTRKGATILETKNIKQNDIEIGFVFIVALVATSALSLYEQTTIVDGNIIPLISHSDVSYYAMVGQYIDDHKTESYVVDAYSNQTYFQLYHYTELWQSRVISRLTGLSTYASLVLCVGSIQLAVIYTSVFALLRRMKSISIGLALLLSLVSLTTPALPWGNIIQSSFFSDTYSFMAYAASSNGYAVKLRLVLILMIVFISEHLKGNRNCAYASLAIIPFVNVSLAFPAITTLAIYIGLNVINEYKKVRTINLISEVSILALVVILFGILLIFQSNATPIEFININDVGMLKTSVNIVIKTILQISLVFGIPIAFILIIKNNHSNLLIALGLGSLSGLLLWALTFPTANSVQLFINYSSAAFIAMWILSGYYIFSQSRFYVLKAVFSFSSILFISVSCYYIEKSKASYHSRHPISFMTNVSNKIAEMNSKIRSVTMYSKEYTRKSIYRSFYPANFQLGFLLWHNTPVYHTIGNPEASDSDDLLIKHIIENSPISALANSSICTPVLNDFIKKNDVNMIILQRGQGLPPNFDIPIDSVIASKELDIQVLFLNR